MDSVLNRNAQGWIQVGGTRGGSSVRQTLTVQVYHGHAMDNQYKSLVPQLLFVGFLSDSGSEDERVIYRRCDNAYSIRYTRICL